MAKVDALTRQLDELKDGNIVNSYHISSAAAGNLNGLIGCQANSSKFNVELEKLKQELLVSGEIWYYLNQVPTVGTNGIVYKSRELFEIRRK